MARHGRDESDEQARLPEDDCLDASAILSLHLLDADCIPRLDCTLTSRGTATCDDEDPMLALANQLMLHGFCASDPTRPTDPKTSPLFANFTGLPVRFPQPDEKEMLRDEAIRTAERADVPGVPIELEIRPGVPHRLQVAGSLAKATLAARGIQRRMRMHAGWDEARTASNRSGTQCAPGGVTRTPKIVLIGVSKPPKLDRISTNVPTVTPCPTHTLPTRH